jgi:hypothetical protein
MLAALYAEVVQATCRRHRQVGEALVGVPQHVFHTPRSLHAGKRVFHPDANLRYLSVLLLLLGSQLLATWLFLGWRVRSTRGSYPWNPLSFSKVDRRG